MTTLHLELPDDFAKPLGHAPAELERAALEALMVRLYANGEVSSGQAAKVLKMPRVAFLDVLGTYGVSVFDPTQDIAAELATLDRVLGPTP